MALFENYEGRMPQLQPVLDKYGFKNFDEVKAYTNSKGVDAYSIVESTQPICFENVKWAYELGAAIAMKEGVKTAAEAAKRIGAGLEDLGKGLRSMVGTMYGTKAKGTRYLEMTEGYVLKMALDKDDQVCGYQFLSLGKMMDAIKKGMSPNEAYEKNIGTYGRFKAEDGAVKWIDPRTDK